MGFSYKGGTIKRFHWAIAIWALWAGGFVGGGYPSGSTALAQSDVPAGHWAKEAVGRLAELGILSGFSDGSFRGADNLTRYQAAVIIHRLLGVIEGELAKGGSPTLASLDQETLEALSRASAELQGSVAGLERRMAAIESRLQGVAQGRENLLDSPTYATLEDLNQLREQLRTTAINFPIVAMPTYADIPAGHWAKEAVNALGQRGLLANSERFRGNSPLTRFEAAVILWRVVQQLESLPTSPPAPAAAPPPAPSAQVPPATPSPIPEGFDFALIGLLEKALAELAVEMRNLGIRVSALESRPQSPVQLPQVSNGLDPNALAELMGAIKEAADTGYAAFMQGEELAARVSSLEGRMGLVEQNSAAMAQSLSTLSNLAQALQMQNEQLLSRLSATESNLDALSLLLAGEIALRTKAIERLDGQVGTLQKDVSDLQNGQNNLQSAQNNLQSAQNNLANNLARVESLGASRDQALAQSLRELQSRLLQLNLSGVVDFSNLNFSGEGFDPKELWPSPQQQRSRFSIGLSGSFKLGEIEATEAKARIDYSDGFRLGRFSMAGSAYGRSFSLRYQSDMKVKLAEYLLNLKADAAELRLALASNLALLAYASGDFAGIGIGLGDSNFGLGVYYAAWERNGGGEGVGITGVASGGGLMARGEATYANGKLAAFVQGAFENRSVQFKVNFRSIDSAFGGAGLALEKTPYTSGQVGFGAFALFRLDPVELDLFYDTRLNVNQNAYGIGLTARFAALAIRGYYNAASAAVVDRPDAVGYDEDSGRFGNNFGLRLRYETKELLLGAEGRFSGLANENLDVEGIARLRLSGRVSLSAFARYHAYLGVESYNNFKVGVGVAAARLLGGVGLEGWAVWRSQSGAVTLEETLLRLAVIVDVAGGNLKAGYARYVGLGNTLVGEVDNVFVDEIYGKTRFGPGSAGRIDRLEGIFLSYELQNLSLFYAIFNRDIGNDGSVEDVGRQFRLRYSLEAPQD